MYEVEIYEDRNGKSEIKNYIRELKENQEKDSQIKFYKIVSYIRILKEKGFSVGYPYIKHIEDDIWELRPLRDRILFAYYDNNKFILLSIFMKKTQKTPKKEIEKAKRYLKEYKRRKS